MRSQKTSGVPRSSGNLASVIKASRYRIFLVDWLTKESNLFTLCFLMGAVHLTIGHAMRGAANLRSTEPVGQAGWIALTWVMFFMARNLIMGVALPAGILYR